MGLSVATGQITAGDTNAHPQDTPAVWDALWASWLISLIIGIPMLGIWESMSNLLSFMVITLVIVMLYPVISFYALSWLGFQQRFPAFIITMTWINNFQGIAGTGNCIIPFKYASAESIAGSNPNYVLDVMGVLAWSNPEPEI